MASKDQHHFVAKARLMLLLGEQLITDEVAAVSELVKNSYDADATSVSVTLKNVSSPDKEEKKTSENRSTSASDQVEKEAPDEWDESTSDQREIEILDNGSGMSEKILLHGWLELGTTIKARSPEEKQRRSKLFNRPILGEKGLGRLAVHKLGKATQIVTRVKGGSEEVVLTIDWNKFDNNEKFLDSIPVQFETRRPKVFVNELQHGTRIRIRNLQRVWDKSRLEELARNLKAISSPIAGIRNFKVDLVTLGADLSVVKDLDFEEIGKNAIYSFDANVSVDGMLSYVYGFRRPEYQKLAREVKGRISILDPKNFPENKTPTCGSFHIVFYSWEGTRDDLKLVFGSTQFYTDVVRRNTGVKLYRDGFRVLPYGDENNDWLGMNLRRIERFDIHISKNLIVGFIEISSKNNPYLVDKSDREGLIDNEQFRDFHYLVINSLQAFENLRIVDRKKLKDLTGRSRGRLKDSFSDSVRKLEAILSGPAFKEVSYENRKAIQQTANEIKESFERLLQETEESLLVAAGIGLGEMLPTHEARRNIREAILISKNLIPKVHQDDVREGLESTLELLHQADDIVASVTRLQQKSAKDEVFPVERAVNHAYSLFKFRLQRRGIVYEFQMRKRFTIVGSERLMAILLTNMLDNSSFWLDKNPANDRRVLIITDKIDDKNVLVVSDNGPGIQDDIETITEPFFSRKPNGMGLGLYIARRIAENHNAQLVLLGQKSLSGLLPGANLGIIFSDNPRRSK